MGLFTGFSILSGIEIVYFALNFFFKKIKNWAFKVFALEMEYECFVFDSNIFSPLRLHSKTEMCNSKMFDVTKVLQKSIEKFDSILTWTY